MAGIDTLEVGVTAVLPEETLQTMNAQKTSHLYRNPNRESINHYKFQLGGNNDDRMPLVSYTVESRNLKITFPSVPYYVMGSSLKKMEDRDVGTFYEKVAQDLWQELRVEPPAPFSEWGVKKSHLYHDFQVGEDVRDYVNALANVSLPRLKSFYVKNETIAWRSSYYTKQIMFYDKHANSIDKKRSQEEVELSKGILRFEVKVRPEDYHTVLGRGDLQLHQIFSQQCRRQMLEKYLNKVGVNALSVTTERQMRAILLRRYKTAEVHRIISFVRDEMNGYDTGLGNDTKRKYKKMLSDVGLSPVIGERELPPLCISPE